jgi:DNA-binding response OmpR family regulator
MLPFWQKVEPMTVQPILIVDDDPEVREVVRQMLTREGYAVLEAATGLEGTRLWEQHDPQLIILDILMPEMSGLQVLEHIRQHDDTPVVMLTRKSGEDDKVRAFELGADDCLSKPFSSRELLVRVKAVLRRAHRPTLPAQPPEVIVGDLRIDLGTQRVCIEDRVVMLSRTEYHLLRELARTPGRVLSREQLVSAVWGSEYHGDPRVLRCAIYRLRQKLEQDATQPRHLCSWRDRGYWLAAPEGPAAPEEREA